MMYCAPFVLPIPAILGTFQAKEPEALTLTMSGWLEVGWFMNVIDDQLFS